MKAFAITKLWFEIYRPPPRPQLQLCGPLQLQDKKMQGDENIPAIQLTCAWKRCYIISLGVSLDAVPIYQRSLIETLLVFGS